MTKTMSPSLFDDIISITEFNKGRAGKIFESVKTGRPKVVFKNNIPECILISPEQYKIMLEDLENFQLMALSEERMKNYDPDKLISSEEIKRKYGYNDQDLSDTDESEFE